MIFRLILLFWITTLSGLLAQEHTSAPLYEFRGVWIATVSNIDWPSKPGLSTEDQKRELLRIFDKHQGMGLNAVIFQVRPTWRPWQEKLFLESLFDLCCS